MSIKQHYNERHASLMAALKITNPMAVPGLEKIVINVGIGKDRTQQGLVDSLTKDIANITGQKPVVTKAKKAISGFKLQKGQSVGLKVTLRSQKMFDFLDRLINAVFPAIRDFRGIPQSSVDSFGNLNIGLSEHTLFPEIGFEQASRAHGVQITVVPSTRKKESAMELYKTIGIPLAIKEQ